MLQKLLFIFDCYRYIIFSFEKTITLFYITVYLSIHNICNYFRTYEFIIKLDSDLVFINVTITKLDNELVSLKPFTNAMLIQIYSGIICSSY